MDNSNIFNQDKPVDFKERMDFMDNVISKLETIKGVLEQEIDLWTSQDKTPDDEKYLEQCQIDLEEKIVEIDIKKQLRDEYKRRSEQMFALDKIEFAEMKTRLVDYVSEAKQLYNNKLLSKELKEHLKLLFDTYKRDFTDAQKIVFMNSLKAEIKICRKTLKK